MFLTTLVAPADTPELTALFSRDASPCHCRFWHFTGTNKEWEARCAFGEADNRRELEQAIAERRDDGLGLVARVEGEPRIVGWMKLAPRRSLVKLLARVPSRGLDEPERPAAETLAIACFLVDPSLRTQGVARALVDGALRIAPTLGAKWVEAYPRVAEQTLHDGEAWMGPVQLFRSAGFEVVREAPQYPVLRKRVG